MSDPIAMYLADILYWFTQNLTGIPVFLSTFYPTQMHAFWCSGYGKSI